MIFDKVGRIERWYLENGRLVFSHPKIDIFWEIPNDFHIPHASKLALAEMILLTPFKENVILENNTKTPTEYSTMNVGVAFSGGVDSTAVLELLPSPIPIYTQVANVTGLHEIDNALLSVEEVGGISVISNYDELAVIYGKRKGFYGTAGFTVTCVLLSEYYNIYTIADGNVLEMMYLFGSGISGHGVLYQEINRTKIMDAFRNAGLEYCVPCAGLTEVSTTKISANGGYKYSMGCMRGKNGNSCDNCLKCFRKKGLQGTPIDSNKEVELKLNARYIPMLPSLLWAKENKGLRHQALENLNRDISWVDKWYDKSLEYIPKYLHNYFLQQLDKHGIKTIKDVIPLVNWTADTEKDYVK